MKKVNLNERHNDLILNFSETLNTEFIIKMGDYYFFSDATGNDKVLIMENFQQRIQFVRLAIEYFTKIGIEIETSEQIKEKLEFIITEQELSQIQYLGRRIKSGDIEIPDIQKSLNSYGFIRQLKPYQILPVYHLYALKNAANFSVPGSGKTTLALAVYALLRGEKFAKKLLVIGPYSCFMPWEDEIKKCFRIPLETKRLHGPRDQRYEAYLFPNKYEVFLTTYETAVNDLEYLMKLVRNDPFMVILDESHHIKGINGKRSNQLLNLNLYPKTKIILTGTPMPNAYLDLFTQLSFLYPSVLLNNAANFKEKTKCVTKIERFLEEKVEPLFTRITKSELDLPPIDLQKLTVKMSRSQTQLYRLISEHYDKVLDELNILNYELIRKYRRAKGIRLRQIASNLNLLTKKSIEYEKIDALVDEIAEDSDHSSGHNIINLLDAIPNLQIDEYSPKMIAARDLARDLRAQGVKKIIIWTDFIDNCILMKNLCQNEFGEANSDLIFGETPKSDDDDIRTNSPDEETREGKLLWFRQHQDFAILVMNPMACAESISLHEECHHAIYLDRSYNCGQFIQSKDRIHRLGLKKGTITHYYFLLSVYDSPEGQPTIDHKIDERLKLKEDRMLEILNDKGAKYVNPVEFEENFEELNDDFRNEMKNVEKSLDEVFKDFE